MMPSDVQYNQALNKVSWGKTPENMENYKRLNAIVQHVIKESAKNIGIMSAICCPVLYD